MFRDYKLALQERVDFFSFAKCLDPSLCNLLNFPYIVYFLANFFFTIFFNSFYCVIGVVAQNKDAAIAIFFLLFFFFILFLTLSFRDFTDLLNIM